MEACAYHEVDEAVGTCHSCEQPVCSKCFDAGSNGLCGMCAEVAAAKVAAPAAPAAASARPAPPARPRSPTGALEGAAAPPRSRTGGLEGGRKPPSRAKATVAPGFCPEHPEERATVACEHCNRRVCGDCLNLYGLCTLCAALPTCARHESMVAEERCQSCKTPYCKGCLNGTPYCPQCREKVGPQGGGKAAKAGTGKLDPAQAPGKAGTGKLDPAQSPGKAGPKGTGKMPPGAKGPKGTGRLAGGKAAAALAPKPGLPWPAIGGGVALLLLVLWYAFTGGKPQLGDAEASAALRDEMTKVQAAAMAYHKRNGEYPNNSQAIMAEMEAQGVKVKELPLPLKLVVNVPPTDPWSIGYSQSGAGFEVRAVDGLGRPFSIDGRDVILRPSLRALPAGGGVAPVPPGPGSPGGANGGEGSGGSAP